MSTTFVDPRPPGKWSVRCTAGKTRSAFLGLAPPQMWHLVALDSAHGDQVVANLHTDDNSPSYWKIPVGTDPARIIQLQRLEPRKSVAKGGTTALLNHLTALADAGGWWLVTEVHAAGGYRRTPVVMGVLAKHGLVSMTSYFESHVMVRPPPGLAYMTRQDDPREVAEAMAYVPQDD